MNRQVSEAGGVRGRKANAPLPAVPVTASPRRNRRLLASQSASCNDLLSSFSVDSSTGRNQHSKLTRALSTDFDLRDTQLIPLLPLSANQDADRLPVRNMSVPQAAPLHDYEELPDRYKEVRLPSVEQSENLHGMSNKQQRCVTASSGSPTNPVQGEVPRDRKNPIYTGTRPKSPFSTTLSDASFLREKGNARITERFARLLLAGIIVANILSVLAIALALSLYLGVMQPALDNTAYDVSALRQDFANFKQHEIADIRQQLNESASDASQLLTQLKNAMESLDDAQLRDTFAKLLSVASPRCLYRTFTIESSSSADVIDSGEYFADPGYTITGVSCSVPDGFAGKLATRDQIINGTTRTYYRCDCSKSSSIVTFPSRLGCRIHYWSCPFY